VARQRAPRVDPAAVDNDGRREIELDGISRALLRVRRLGGRCCELTGHLRVLLRFVSSASARARRRRNRDRSPALPPIGLGRPVPAGAAASEHLAVHCAEVPRNGEFLRARGAEPSPLCFGNGAAAWGSVRRCRRGAGSNSSGCRARRSSCCQARTPARASRRRWSIAVCPGTIAWFRTPPPVPSWLPPASPWRSTIPRQQRASMVESPGLPLGPVVRRSSGHGERHGGAARQRLAAHAARANRLARSAGPRQLRASSTSCRGRCPRCSWSAGRRHPARLRRRGEPASF
jgi:hypothetical protein